MRFDERLGLFLALFALFGACACVTVQAGTSDAESDVQVLSGDGYSTAGTSYWTMKLDLNGGVAPDWMGDCEFLVKKGTTVQLPAASITKTGYYLASWKLTEEKYIESGGEFTPEGDVTLTATWAKVEGNKIESLNLVYDVGDVVDEEVYVATGWTERNAGKWNHDSSIWSSYFQWQPRYGGENNHYGVKGTAPDDPGVYVLKVNYSSGIPLDNKAPIWFTITVRSEMDYPVNITYDFDGGYGNAIPVQTIPAGTATILKGPDAATKDGYDITGWNGTDGANTVAYSLDSLYVAIPQVSDQNLKAKWEPQSKAIVFISTDAEGRPFVKSAESVESDSAIYFPTMDEAEEKAGFDSGGNTLGGWYVEGANDVIYAPGYGYHIPADSKSAIYVYAYWLDPDDADSITVSFDANGGDDRKLTAVLESGMKVATPIHGFTYSGHYLVGWGAEKGTTEVQWDCNESVTVESDKTFYAVWAEGEDPTTRTYEVTFNTAGGTPTPDMVVAEYGATITAVNPPSKSGYLFEGWYLDGTGDSSKWEFGVGGKQVTDDMVLTAHWIEHYDIEDRSNGAIKLTLSDSATMLGTNYIDWGDGSDVKETSGKTETHSYAKTGYYTVSVKSGETNLYTSATRIYVVVEQEPEPEPEPDPSVEPVAVISMQEQGDGNWVLSANESTGFETVKWTIYDAEYTSAVVVTTDEWAEGDYVVKLTVYNGNGEPSETVEESFTIDRGGEPDNPNDDDTDKDKTTEGDGGDEWIYYTVAIAAVVMVAVIIWKVAL